MKRTPIFEADGSKMPMKSKVYYTVRIPVDSHEHIDDINKIRSSLSKKGVHFDTGMMMEDNMISYIEWELDWSLKGPYTADQILKLLKRKGVRYITRIKPRRY